MKSDLTKFAEIYKECIIIGSIDPEETENKQNNKEYLQLEEKRQFLTNLI